MGGSEIFYSEVKSGMYVVVLEHNSLNVSGFYIDDKVGVTDVPSYKTQEYSLQRIPCTKVVFKNIDKRFFARAQQFLDGEGELHHFRKTSRSRGFFAFSAKDSLFYTPPGTKIKTIIEKVIFS
jgi:hypothetical protein